jgi:hypothetical protein
MGGLADAGGSEEDFEQAVSISQCLDNPKSDGVELYEGNY